MRRPRPRSLLLTTALILAVLAPAGAQSTLNLSDPLPGSTRLPNGWAMDPAGKQVLTLRAPTGVTIAPDGSIYAVTSGIFDEGIVRVDPTTLLPTPTLVGQTFQGVAADAKGHVWVSGATTNTVYEYLAAGPALIDARLAGPVPIPGEPNAGIPVTGFPGSMLLEGNKLFVAGSMSVPSSVARAAGGAACLDSTICGIVSVVDVSDPLSVKPSVHAVSVGRDAYGLAYRASSNTLYVSNFADATNPARATGTVSVVKMNADGSGAQEQVYKVGNAPAGIALSPDGSTLAVANSDSDSVSLLSIGSAGTITDSRTVDVRLSPDAPLGAAPSAVKYLPDGRLLVALAGIDALEVLDASGNPIPQHVTVDYRGRTVHVRVPATYLPTAWYPDALAVGTAPGGGARVVVANLRGDGSGPGYYGQLQPLVGTSTEGTLSVIDLPTDARALASDLNAYTARVVRDDNLAPVEDAALPDPATNACVGGTKPGGGTYSTGILCAAQKGLLDPKQVHVLVINAENKTFDSYFGDMKSTLTNADASPLFTEYGNAVTTNQHNLATSFTLSDNFWNEGAEASTLGHDWLTAGYTTLDREITWGQEYDEGIRGDRSGGRYAGTVVSGTHDRASGAVESAMMQPRTRLSDLALAHGLSVRIFGTDVNGGSPSQADQVPQALWGEGPNSPTPGSDLGFPDTDRANMFLHGSTTSHAWDVLTGAPPNSPNPAKILPPPTFGKTIAFNAADKQKYSLDGWTAAYKGCVSKGGSDAACQSAMPNYLYMGLPENHTYDVSNIFNPLDPTPQSMVADNDYAIGLILQGLSQSPFWRNTIVFLTEDDNQFTGDHVDIHRTFLLTMGGLANRLGLQGQVSHQLGSFASVLKTTEVLLHLPPLTLFDWRATPLGDVVAPSLAGVNSAAYSSVVPPTPFFGRGAP